MPFKNSNMMLHAPRCNSWTVVTVVNSSGILVLRPECGRPRSTFPAMNAAEAPEHPPKTPRSLRCLQAHSKPLSYQQRTFVHYVHKVDSALRSAASGLETQIRRRLHQGWLLILVLLPQKLIFGL